MPDMSSILEDLQIIIDAGKCDDIMCADCNLESGTCAQVAAHAAWRVEAWLDSLPEGAISQITLSDLL